MTDNRRREVAKHLLELRGGRSEQEGSSCDGSNKDETTFSSSLTPSNRSRSSCNVEVYPKFQPVDNPLAPVRRRCRELLQLPLCPQAGSKKRRLNLVDSFDPHQHQHRQQPQPFVNCFVEGQFDDAPEPPKLPPIRNKYYQKQQQTQRQHNQQQQQPFVRQRGAPISSSHDQHQCHEGLRDSTSSPFSLFGLSGEPQLSQQSNASASPNCLFHHVDESTTPSLKSNPSNLITASEDRGVTMLHAANLSQQQRDQQHSLPMALRPMALSVSVPAPLAQVAFPVAPTAYLQNGRTITKYAAAANISSSCNLFPVSIAPRPKDTNISIPIPGAAGRVTMPRQKSKKTPLLTAVQEVTPTMMPPLLSVSYRERFETMIGEQHPNPLLLPNGTSCFPLPSYIVSTKVLSDVETQYNPITNTELLPDDILLGRGGQTNHHPGNITFRNIVQHYRIAYIQARKGQKSVLARNLYLYFRHVKQCRFLMKETPAPTTTNDKRNGDDIVGTTTAAATAATWGTSGDGDWFEAGEDRGIKKCGQTLREGTADVVRQSLQRHHQQQATGSTNATKDDANDHDFDEIGKKDVKNGKRSQGGNNKSKATQNGNLTPMFTNAINTFQGGATGRATGSRVTTKKPLTVEKGFTGCSDERNRVITPPNLQQIGKDYHNYDDGDDSVDLCCDEELDSDDVDHC